MSTLDDALARLVARDVLSAAQADAVRAEVAQPYAVTVSAPLPPPVPSPVPGWVPAAPAAGRGLSPVVEVAAYLGGVLTLVALGFLVAEPWRHAARPVRVVLLALLTAVLVAAGAALRDRDGRDPVRGRLAGTLWATAVLAVAGTAVVLAGHGSTSDETATFVVGLVATALAVPLYLVQRRGAQLVALVPAGATLVGGLALVATHDGTFVAVVLGLYGLAVVAAGAAGALDPPGAAVALGAVTALVSVQAGSFGDARTAMLAFGVAVAAGLFAVATRTGAVLAGIATAGTAILLPQLISRVGGGGAGVPALLLVTGLTLLGGAVLTSRLRRR
jgi:hypothetical protein